MPEIYINCPYCETANIFRTQISREKLICIACRNSLYYCEYKEVVLPVEIRIVKTETKNPNYPESVKNALPSESSYGISLAFLISFSALAFFIFLPIFFPPNTTGIHNAVSSQPPILPITSLSKEPAIDSKGISFDSSEEIDDPLANAEAIDEEEVASISVLKEPNCLQDIMKYVEFRRMSDDWSFSESAVDNFWIKVKSFASNCGLSESDFWMKFGTEMVKDYQLPISLMSQKSQAEDALCPLKIITKSEMGYYLIKLQEIHLGQEFRFFISAGSDFEVKIPSGDYSLRYCFGENWYGDHFRFGPQKNYFLAPETLSFLVNRSGDQFQFSGHTIELIRQPGGNFQTKPIPEKDF